jgi:hypothetical protein
MKYAGETGDSDQALTKILDNANKAKEKQTFQCDSESFTTVFFEAKREEVQTEYYKGLSVDLTEIQHYTQSLIRDIESIGDVVKYWNKEIEVRQ